MSDLLADIWESVNWALVTTIMVILAVMGLISWGVVTLADRADHQWDFCTKHGGHVVLWDVKDGNTKVCVDPEGRIIYR